MTLTFGRLSIAVSGLVLASAGFLAFLFVTGRWIPNVPDENFSVRGIDVSHHQGTIDWAKIPRDVAFAYIKATEGGDWKDSQFVANWQSSASSSRRRGAYHFFSLRVAGEEQARNFISAVPLDPYALPPAVDLEFEGNSKARPTVKEFQAELSKMIALLQAHYHKEPIIYTTYSFRGHYLQGFPIGRLWIRDIFRKPHGFAERSWLIWQFTAHGRIPGIIGTVDLNVLRGNRHILELLATDLIAGDS